MTEESNKKNTDNIIAFQGVKGAHSDLACRKAYPYMDSMACESFEDAFKAVENGDAKYCMIPVGNSYAGRVAEIHNLIPNTSLSIVAEHFSRIEHQLVSVEGATKETIKEVYSHPQALMQCKKHIDELGYKAIKHANTAVAAKEISESGDKTKAAICSVLAKELYGLTTIEENFEDDSGNTTLFLVFSREPIDPDPEKDGEIITSMLFTTRNIAAGLYKALGGFATNNVNLIKLESYIPEVESSQAQFFISFEGSPNQRNVQMAIEELGYFSKRTKLLGVYPADKKRVIEDSIM
jgi:prephenate dehydratase